MPRNNNIQVRRGTLAQWQGLNPVLADGEVAFAKDTKALYVGDGFTPFSGLTPVSGGGGGGGGGGREGIVTLTPDENNRVLVAGNYVSYTIMGNATTEVGFDHNTLTVEPFGLLAFPATMTIDAPHVSLQVDGKPMQFGTFTPFDTPEGTSWYGVLVGRG